MQTGLHMVDLTDKTGQRPWWHSPAQVEGLYDKHCMPIGRTLDLHMRQIVWRMNFKCKVISAFCTGPSSPGAWSEQSQAS